MTFQKKEEPLPIRGRRHHPERSSTLMRFPMRSYGYIHGHPHGHTSIDTHMDTSIDTHMDMSMDIHMEMPIKSKVSKLDGLYIQSEPAASRALRRWSNNPSAEGLIINDP